MKKYTIIAALSILLNGLLLGHCQVPCGVYGDPVRFSQMLADRELSSIEQGRELVAQSFELKKYQPVGSDSWDEAYSNMLQMRKSDE